MYINTYRCQRSKEIWGGNPVYRSQSRPIDMDDQARKYYNEMSNGTGYRICMICFLNMD